MRFSDTFSVPPPTETSPLLLRIIFAREKIFSRYCPGGWGPAGRGRVKRLVETGEEEVKRRFSAILEFVFALAKGRNGSHAAGIAAVATADAFIEEWFFGAHPLDADDRAIKMAAAIIKSNQENAVRDVNETAAQYVADWISSNIKGFTGTGNGPLLGEITGRTAYVFPSLLNKAISDGGYSARKTLKYLAEQGVIETDVENGRVRYSMNRRYQGGLQRFVKIDLNMLELSPEERSRSHSDENVPTFGEQEDFEEVQEELDLF